MTVHVTAIQNIMAATWNACFI